MSCPVCGQDWEESDSIFCTASQQLFMYIGVILDYMSGIGTKELLNKKW